MEVKVIKFLLPMQVEIDDCYAKSYVDDLLIVPRLLSAYAPLPGFESKLARVDVKNLKRKLR